MNTETIQIRIDAKTKQEARETLDALGIDISGAVKLFLRNVINSQSIPLDLRTENGFTLAQEQMMLEEIEEAKNSSKRYASAEDLLKDLND